MVFIRPAWQLDGGVCSAPDGVYDLLLAWQGEGLRVAAPRSGPVPDRIALLWRDCGTWTDAPITEPLTSFRLVLARLPLPSAKHFFSFEELL